MLLFGPAAGSQVGPVLQPTDHLHLRRRIMYTTCLLTAIVPIPAQQTLHFIHALANGSRFGLPLLEAEVKRARLEALG
eukprot:14180149-Alexandrium_andersonii.AAC.1